MKENMVFFLYTKSADVGYGIVWCSSFHNVPFNCVLYIYSLQFVDISAQTGSISLWMVHVIGVVPIPALHGLGSGPCIGFHLACVSPCDSGSVDHIVNKATYARQNWAGFRFLRSALTTTTKGLLDCCCSIVTIQNFVIVF